MISILLPVKNEQRYIGDCLDSILCQSCRDYELIIVDDHSTDDTHDRILSHPLHTQGKIKLILNDGNGLIDALNTGWPHISRPYITRMDGDDRMGPDRLDHMLTALMSCRQPTLVTGGVRYFPRRDLPSGYRRYEQWLNEVQTQQSHTQWIYRECVFASPNWMMKTHELATTGAFTGLDYPEDYALALRLHANGVHFKSIPRTTLYWRHHPDRMSLHHAGYHQRAFFRLKIRHFVKNEWQQDRPVIIWGQNEKARLTRLHLRELDIPHITLSQDQVHHTRDYPSPLVLIAVYPDPPIRQQFRKYLDDLGLTEGKGYCFCNA